MITHYTYIKNISFDKETALAKYPNATLDENLRGKTASWSSQPKEVWDNVNCYRFGRYKYEVIGLSDLTYLEWYWNQLEEGDHKDYVSSYLEGCGYEIRISGTSKYLMSPEALENERKTEEEKNKVLTTLNTHNPFEICFDHNPDYDGDCRIGDVIYHFQEVHENYYQGWEYYLPVLNGKQKRIKNKNLIIKDYTYETKENGLITVEILDFEVKK